MVVLVIDGADASAGGSDVTPDAVDWADISVTSTSTGYEHNAAVTLAAIDAEVTLKAAWTSSSSNPAKGQWIKNGVAVAALGLTPVFVNASVGDMLYFAMAVNYTYPAGNYDTGTVTVTNESDGAATLDTFAFAVQYVYSASGGTGGIPGNPVDNNPNGGDGVAN